MKTDASGKEAQERPAIERGDASHAGKSSNKQTEPVTRNVQAIADLERKVLGDRKQFSRLSEFFTKIAASPAFIAGHLIVFSGWIILNATHVVTFDPHPFDILNLTLTFEAIILTSVVLIAQRDLRRLADMRGHLDLQVNMLAEQELTAILGLLNQVCAKLGIDPKKAEPDVEQLAKDTDVRKIVTALEEGLDEQPR